MAQAGGRGGRPGGRHPDGVIGLILTNIPTLTLPFDYTVFLTVLVLVWYIMTELGPRGERRSPSAPRARLAPQLSPPWSPPWTEQGTSWAAGTREKVNREKEDGT